MKLKTLKLKTIIIALCLLASALPQKTIASSQENLPYPYNQLSQLLPFNDHGWYLNALWIEKLIKNNPVKSVVEVGSWMGASTRHIASLLPNDGKLYAIDTWEGSANHQAEPYASMLPNLYEQFLSNVIHAGLTKKIIPLKMTSVQAAQLLQHSHDYFDLIYIDASHDTESVLQDLEAYFPFVFGRHGILCGDDWLWDSVKAAISIFAKKYNLTVYAGDNFWFFVENNKFQILPLQKVPNKSWKFL